MTPHPVAEIFPTWSEDALAALTADIRAQGLIEPIVTLDGQILDGRHRLIACQAAGVTPQFVEFEGDDPLAFVIAKNLHRRHLNESQRSMVAARIALVRHGGDRRSGDFKRQICHLNREQAAEALNVSEKSVQSARKVLDLGLPALTHIVEQGQMPVSTAAAVAELPDAEQEKIVRIEDAKARRTAARAVLLKVCPERRRRDQPKGRPKPRKVNIVTGGTPPSDEDLALYAPILRMLRTGYEHLNGRNPECWLASSCAGSPGVSPTTPKPWRPISPRPSPCWPPFMMNCKGRNVVANSFADFCKQAMLEYAEDHTLDHNGEVQIEV